MPNSPKLPNSVQEVFHEVSEPNPMGNAVVSEETHGNAVAGAAAAASCRHCVLSKFPHQHALSNQAHFFRTATSFYLVLLPPPPPPPPPTLQNKGVVVGNDA